MIESVSRCRRTCAICLLGLLVWQGAMSDEQAPFRIDRAKFTLDQTLLLLQVFVESNIPEHIVNAIDQGFAVPFMLEVEIRAKKAYWIDDRIVRLKQQYLLHHLPILDSYVVLDVNNAQRHYFDNRKAAVEFMELVYNYPMLDLNNLPPGRDYYARVRFGIDTDELPLPLKSSSFWDDDWDLQSEWYEWEVGEPGV